jgi:type II secretory pathway pseudopilin PulG
VRAWIDTRIGGGPESGLTMIEVLVAAVVLVMGAAATFGILGGATRNAQRAKATQVALDLAQEELERLHSLPYDCAKVPAGGSCLALDKNTLPSHENGEKKPNSRVNGGLFALQRNPPNDYFPLDAETEKGFSSASPFNTGDGEAGGIRGTIYRYVVWRNDPSCTTPACEESEHDYKQIVVAVKPDTPVNQQSETGYVEVQSAAITPAEYEKSPEEIEEEEKQHEEEQKEQEEKELEEEGGGGEGEEEGGGGPGGGKGSDVTAQQFFLSDTACAASGATERQEISEDHLLHNTLGTCASGLKSGTGLGAPDVLLDAAPPDPFPEDEALPSLHDYSDDFYLEPTPDTDKGVQIRRDDTSGCHYNPTGTTHPESQVHRWVTDPMPQAFEMGGKVVLEFYTRTLNDALYTGTLCVYLFERQETGPAESPTAEDTMLISPEGSPYWTYTPQGNGYWPRNSWTKVRLTMEFQEAPRVIPAGRRLGLGLSVDRANTPADAIPVMYDHPNYASRLEVDTKTPIEGG